jgi:hypothetical protein
MPATAVGTTVSNVPSAKVTEASAATSSTAEDEKASDLTSAVPIEEPCWPMPPRAP